jgi:hypothetical protein
MNYVERLKQHIGNLVEIEYPLYWFGEYGNWDFSLKERVCILLDANYKFMRPGHIKMSGTSGGSEVELDAIVCLFIDNVPHWFYITDRTLRIIY